MIFNECYVVYPRNATKKGKGKACPEGFKYTSDTNKEWLTVKDLSKFVEEISDDYTIEKSRWSMGDVAK